VAQDYDAPRRQRAEDEPDETELAAIRQATKVTEVLDTDGPDAESGLELPWAELQDQDLEIRVVPRQADEFTCSRCFLVQHRSRLARSRGKQQICRDCA
jgi:hypothetical protein